MIDFAVIGLPRSGTTWIANWLTTDRSFCLHDPWLYGMVPSAWPRPEPGRLFGISCTGSYMHAEFMESLDCPIIKVVRDPINCETSLVKEGFSGYIPRMQHYFSDADGMRVNFDGLWDEDCARFVWSYLLPRIPFDGLRYRQLVNMRVVPHRRVVEMIREKIA